MIRAFFDNRLLILLFIPVFAGGYVFLNFYSNYYESNGILDLGFWGKHNSGSFLTDILATSLLTIISVFLNVRFNKSEFMERNNYFVSLLFIVFASQFYGFYHLTGATIATCFLALSLVQILKLNQNLDGRRNIFNATLFLGVGITFYPPLIILFPLFFILIWVLRPFIFRESFLAVLGTLIPFTYISFYYFFTSFELDVFGILPIELIGFSHHFLISLGLFALVLISTVNLYNAKKRQISIRLKKQLRVIFLFFVSLLIVTITMAFINFDFEAIMFTAVPLSFIVTFGFGTKEPSPWSELSFYLFIIFSISKFFIPLTFSLSEIF